MQRSVEARNGQFLPTTHRSGKLPSMTDNQGWGRRLRDARRDWEKLADGELGFKEIGIEVAALIGRETDYTYQAVSKWFAGSEPESFAVVEALAKILNVSPGYLAFGETPDDEELSDAEITERIARVADEAHRASDPPKPREQHRGPRKRA